MNNIKRYFCTVISLVIVLTAIGCKPFSDDSPMGSGKLKIGVCISRYDDASIDSVRKAIEAAAKTSNVDLIMSDSKNNQETQNNQIDKAIQSGVQALAVDIVDADATSVVVSKAQAADIPVIFFGREPELNTIRTYSKACFVGTNPEEAGMIQGQIMLNIWRKGDWDKNKDGKIQYVMLMGDAGSIGATVQTESSIYAVVRGGIVIENVSENKGAGKAKTTMADVSVNTVIRGGVDVERIGEAFADWDHNKAKVIMADWLINGADKIEFVIANSDAMAAGAIEALQEAGYNKGDGVNYIPVIGVDATDEAINLINKGYMSGTVKKDSAGVGSAVVALAKNAAEDKDLLSGTKHKFDDSGVAVRIPYQPFMMGVDQTSIETQIADMQRSVQPVSGQKIGVAMPSVELQRWNQDGANIKSQLEAAGYTVDLQYANDNVATQVSQVRDMIDSGCKVLVIAAIDGNSLGEVLVKAKEANIPVIAYDRLIMNSDAVTFYVAFDNYMVGTIQGEYLRDALKLDTARGPFNIEIFAGSDDDSTSPLVYNGAMDILAPYMDSGKLVVVSGQKKFEEASIPGWTTEAAQARMKQLIAANYAAGTRLDAVCSPNDSIANGIANALIAEGYTKDDFPLITGQDCDILSIKNMLAGIQSMSIFVDTRTLASKTVEMVDTIIKGTPVAINDTKTYDNGKGIVPSYLCSPVFVTVDNYREVLINSGYYTADQLK